MERLLACLSAVLVISCTGEKKLSLQRSGPRPLVPEVRPSDVTPRGDATPTPLPTTEPGSGASHFSFTLLEAANHTVYGTYSSHNQRVVSNRSGIFVAYGFMASATDPSAGSWRLARSTDGGRSFTVVFDARQDGDIPQKYDLIGPYAPLLEGDDEGNIYVVVANTTGPLTGPVPPGTTDVAMNMQTGAIARFYKFAPVGETFAPVIRAKAIPGMGMSPKNTLLRSPDTRSLHLAVETEYVMKFSTLTETGAFAPGGEPYSILRPEVLENAAEKALCKNSANESLHFMGPRAHYPHLSLDGDGTLYMAWTLIGRCRDGVPSDNSDYAGIHIMKSSGAQKGQAGHWRRVRDDAPLAPSASEFPHVLWLWDAATSSYPNDGGHRGPAYPGIVAHALSLPQQEQPVDQIITDGENNRGSLQSFQASGGVLHFSYSNDIFKSSGCLGNPSQEACRIIRATGYTRAAPTGSGLDQGLRRYDVRKGWHFSDEQNLDEVRINGNESLSGFFATSSSSNRQSLYSVQVSSTWNEESAPVFYARRHQLVVLKSEDNGQSWHLVARSGADTPGIGMEFLNNPAQIMMVSGARHVDGEGRLHGAVMVLPRDETCEKSSNVELCYTSGTYSPDSRMTKKGLRTVYFQVKVEP